MIKQITIREVASYDRKGVTLPNLSKINFIYGSNGCGKTTLSNCLANPDSPIFAQCSIEWEAGKRVKCFVYNKAFRDNNFGKGDIAGVFTLGQATKEQLEAIEKKILERNELREAIAKKKETRDNLLKERDEHVSNFNNEIWELAYKKYERIFPRAFDGVRNSKNSFREKLVKQSTNSSANLLEYEELCNKSSTLFGNKPENIPNIAKIETNRITELEKHPIWTQSIVGKADIPIAELISKLQNGDWINQGRKFLEVSNNTCPFCQQETITIEFRKNLELFFDNTYRENIALLSKLSSQYEQECNLIVESLEKLISSAKLSIVYKLELGTLENFRDFLKSKLYANKLLILKKQQQPSEKINIEELSSTLEKINSLISDANDRAENYNSLVQNFEREKLRLIDEIWTFLCNEFKTHLERFTKNLNGRDKGLSLLKEQINDLEKKDNNLNTQIIEENKKITSVQPAVDEINKLLQTFGFLNFKIVQSETNKNQYQIQREDGSLAESTLSEGEITFITFLYFMQLANGAHSESEVSEERVLVIDDPISSLDSNVLFIVSTILKKEINQVRRGQGLVRQIFILTHNVYFHKEVSFLGSGKEIGSDATFWIIRKQNLVSSVECYGTKSPITNSYELLWKEYNNVNITSSIAIQNTMRRIIENYFKILGGINYEDLIDKFEDHNERLICNSLFSWINEGSHTLPDDLYVEEQGDLTARYREVFKRIFYATNHGSHFEMMMNKHQLNLSIQNPALLEASG